jgi:hypothetical protein
MAFPTSQIDTTNLDSATDDPSLARADLYDAVTALNSIIADKNAANGVLVLGSTGKITATQLPATITSTGTQVFNPTNGVVNIQNVLRLSSLTVAQANALTTNTTGDIAMISDGDAGSLCVAVYDGTNWKRIALGTTISAT